MDSYAHMASMSTAPLPYSLYEQFPVCRLCYRLYQATAALSAAAKEFASALAVPLDAQPVDVPLQYISATQETKEFSLIAG